jgi:hypothetical protein
VAAPGLDPADADAIVADSRLIRTVRWRLVFWSGLSTLVVLLILGLALYWSAQQSLQASGVAVLSNRTNQIVDVLQNPHGRPDPEYGFIFGGDSSGTLAIPLTRTATISRGASSCPPACRSVNRSPRRPPATWTSARPCSGASPSAR